MLNYIEYCESNNIVPKFKNKEIKTWIYPICGPLKRIVSDRVLLLGDAAGFVNPLNGEGIHYAMYSGDVAADVFVGAFKNKDFCKKNLIMYDKICMNRFGKYLKRCVGIQNNNLKTMKYVVRYATKSYNVLMGPHDLFNENLNPKRVALKTGFYLLNEIIKAKLHLSKTK